MSDIQEDIKNWTVAQKQMQSRIDSGEVELEINKVVLEYATKKLNILEKLVKKEETN